MFLLNLLGYQQARNYDGSMYEWANLEESEAPMAATDCINPDGPDLQDTAIPLRNYLKSPFSLRGRVRMGVNRSGELALKRKITEAQLLLR